MSGLFTGRTAVVTGVTSGIGRAALLRLLAEGAEVVGLGRNAQKLGALASEAGPGLRTICADLAAREGRAAAIRELTALAKPVDFFVSNAGEAAYVSPSEIDAELLRRLFEINVGAPLELCQALLPALGRGGHIVQISSVTADYIANAKFGAYSMTKLAVERLLEALRLELHPKNIRVSTIAPGLVDTPIYDKLPNFGETRRRMNDQVPRWLSADDVADAIVWVLSRPPHLAVTELTLMPATQAR